MQAVDTSDDQLWMACRKLPSDFEPFGQRKWLGQPAARQDCATCKWFAEIYRTWPDWGACTNPDSPRRDLLTFWEQGCWQFKQEKGRHHKEPHGGRCNFKNAFENLLLDQAGDFVREKIREANDPLADEATAAASPEDICESPIFLILRRLLKHADEGGRRKSLDDIAAKARHDTRRYWEYARREWAREFGEEVSAIRLPNNMRELEDEFWGRVEIIVREALRGRGSRPAKKKRRRAGQGTDGD